MEQIKISKSKVGLKKFAAQNDGAASGWETIKTKQQPFLKKNDFNKLF
jgi:hypothetical protein